MKSYGRAPSFLTLTGYEQTRSVIAEIAGDHEAAARVELVLPGQRGVRRFRAVRSAARRRRLLRTVGHPGAELLTIGTASAESSYS